MSAIKCSTCGAVGDSRGATLHCNACYKKATSDRTAIFSDYWESLKWTGETPPGGFTKAELKYNMEQAFNAAIGCQDNGKTANNKDNLNLG